MPQPIANIINRAGLDWENMKSIKKTPDTENKIKKTFREMWQEGTITDTDICDNLFDYNGAPGWIKDAIEKERSAIQHEISS